MEVVARTSKQIWRSTNGFKIKHCGNHRVHDVPYKFMNRAATKSICETIGRRIFRRPMRPLPIQRQEGEFLGTVADRTGKGEAIMEIKKSGDDINSKSDTNSKSVIDKERELETGNVPNQEKPNPLFFQSISKNNCHDHLFPQSRSENKCQGDLFFSQLLVIDKEIRKFDITGTKEVGHTSIASSEGEREKPHKFPPSPWTTHSSVQKWKPPDHRLVKINCDGAKFAKENRAGIGVVIRNSEGMVLGSLSTQLSQAFSPLQIEAMAVETAMQFAIDLEVQHAIFETDSLVLVKPLHEGTEFLPRVDLVLDEIRNMVKFFIELHYSRVKR